MKHLQTLCLSLMALLLPVVATSQESGKPLYSIRVERDGDSIGVMLIEMFPEIAPAHVRNFDSLVSIGFYDSTAFHRVIPGFMIQGGDPNSRNQPRSTWGYGDPSQQTVPAEFSNLSHVRGIISAARTSDPNSATSQFFICHGNPTFLDRNYSIYGRVIWGINLVDTIVNAPRDAGDNPFQKHSMFITSLGVDTTVTPVPVLRSPVADARYVTVPAQLTWDSVPGAILYRVQISRTADFSIIDTTIETLTPRLSRTVQAGRKDYYWRVAATNGGRPSEYSAARKFTTAITAAKIVSPKTGTTVQTTSPVLIWNRVEGSTSYRVQVSTLLTFATLLLDRTDLQDTSLALSDLVPGTKYYWRVRAYEDTAAGPLSGNASFTVSGPSSVGRESSLHGARPELVIGAPGSGTATLTITLEHSADVRLMITDIAGRDLREIHTGALAPGDHRFPVDLSELPSGTYLLRIEQDGESVARTFQVAK